MSRKRTCPVHGPDAAPLTAEAVAERLKGLLGTLSPDERRQAVPLILDALTDDIGFHAAEAAKHLHHVRRDLLLAVEAYIDLDSYYQGRLQRWGRPPKEAGRNAELLYLHEAKGVKTARLAVRYGMKESAVKTAISRARAKRDADA
jgi:hypothetical protein